MDWVHAIMQWGASGALLTYAARSRPVRTFGRVISAEIRRRYEAYLRRRGVAEAEIKRLLEDDRDTEGGKDEPPKAVA